MSNSTAALCVEPKRLFEALKFAFSNTSSVITELMQNARRAGASQVRFVAPRDGHELTVMDDGIGIENLSILLRMAESGWNEKIVEEESAYGLGFLSCLFAASRLSVYSLGREFAAETAEILDLKEIEILESVAKQENSMWGTTCIKLEGVKIDFEEIESVLAYNATGFPIPVIFNGTPLARPNADLGDQHFVSTSIGRMRIRGIDVKGGMPNACFGNGRGMVYLQGVPVKLERHSPRYERNADVIHLDSKQFGARWPDRDTLHNLAQAKDQISRVYKERLRAFLAQELAMLGHDAFIERYQKLHYSSAPELFTNDVPFVHRAFLCSAEYPKRLPDWWDHGVSNSGIDNLSREEIETGGVLIVDIEDEYDPEVNAKAWMAVYGSGRCVGVPYSDRLPEWAKECLVKDADLKVEIEGIEGQVLFASDWVMEEVILCREYKIVRTATGEVLATFTRDAAFLPVEDEEEPRSFIVVPAGESSGEVTHQVSDFVMDDDYKESSFDEAAAAFSRLLMTERGDPAGVMQDILRASQAAQLEKLRGKHFRVVIDDAGVIQVVCE